MISDFRESVAARGLVRESADRVVVGFLFTALAGVDD